MGAAREPPRQRGYTMFGLWKSDAPKKTPKDLEKESKKATRKSNRAIEREIQTLERQEKKVEGDIKKLAKAGRMAEAKLMAQNLVQTRAGVAKLYQAKAQISGIASKGQALKTNMAMSEAMKSGTQAMAAMNKQLNPIEQQKIAAQFARESDRTDMLAETFDDLFDSMMDSDEDAEADAMVDQIFTELNIQNTAGMTGAGTAPVALQEPAVAEPQGRVAMGMDGMMGGPALPPSGGAGGGAPGGGGGGGGGGGLESLEERMARLQRGD